MNSALLNLVALVCAEAGVLCRAHGVARLRRHAGVALADDPGVLIVRLAAAAQVGRRLDASATDLEDRLGWVRHLQDSQ